MKQIISILILYFFIPFSLCAQPYNAEDSSDLPCTTDSVIVIRQHVPPVFFEINQYKLKITPRLHATLDSVVKYQTNCSSLWIHGSASPEGPMQWNQKLGQYRANALVHYLAQETGITAHTFHTENQGENWRSLEKILENDPNFPHKERILEILSTEPDSETRKFKIKAIDKGETWNKLIAEIYPKLRYASLTLITYYAKQPPITPTISLMYPSTPPVKISSLHSSEQTSFYDTGKRSDWKIALKTNLLFDAMLVANLGLEISPWTHWSFDIPVWYSPYNISSTRNIRLLAVQPEIRWWAKEAMTGHFIGLHTHIAGFNIALNNYARYQDPNHALWGLGLSYGYAMSLGTNAHWGLEFNIGAGFAKYRYDAYRNWDNGPKFKSGSDCYWGVTRAGVTLSYKWNLSRKNHTK